MLTRNLRIQCTTQDTYILYCDAYLPVSRVNGIFRDSEIVRRWLWPIGGAATPPSLLPEVRDDASSPPSRECSAEIPETREDVIVEKYNTMCWARYFCVIIRNMDLYTFVDTITSRTQNYILVRKMVAFVLYATMCYSMRHFWVKGTSQNISLGMKLFILICFVCFDG